MAKSSEKTKKVTTKGPAIGLDEALQKKLFELDVITYYLNSILTNISQGLIFVDYQGVVTTYNRAAQQFF